MTESSFQHSVIEELKDRFPDCIILKNDPTYIQGFPDLTIFWFEKWATLECKKSRTASHRPNQDYYINRLNEMSFSAFIYPENRQEVLDDLERAFKGYA